MDLRVIHQVLPAFVGGDAIGNFAQQIRQGLRTLGFESRLYAASVEPAKRGQALRVSDLHRESRGDVGLIYHHSIGSALTEYLASWPGPRMMVYHNITPGCLVRAYNPSFADLLDAGRRALPKLVDVFSMGVGVSEFNRGDLVDAGFSRTAVLPIPLDSPSMLRVARRVVWPENGEPAGAKLLFVGRMLPHKRPDRLVEWFEHFLRYADPAARLVLVGGLDDRFKSYNEALIRRVRAGNGRVRLAGRVSRAELVNWYRWADGFVSLSDHEGFMVPLLEAMATDTVVFAKRIPAVAETLGRAGVQFEGAGPATMTALVHEILTDADVRRAVLKTQADRLRSFSPHTFLARLAAVVEEWLGEPE